MRQTVVTFLPLGCAGRITCCKYNIIRTIPYISVLIFDFEDVYIRCFCNCLGRLKCRRQKRHQLQLKTLPYRATDIEIYFQSRDYFSFISKVYNGCSLFKELDTCCVLYSMLIDVFQRSTSTRHEILN